jgi:dTDP-glucose 4,6-dehydratase
MAKLICNKYDKLYNKKNSSKLIKFVDDRLGHDFRYAIDNKKIRNLIKWKPRTSFEKGIIKTIKFYKKNNKNISNIFFK